MNSCTCVLECMRNSSHSVRHDSLTCSLCQYFCLYCTHELCKHDPHHRKDDILEPEGRLTHQSIHPPKQRPACVQAATHPESPATQKQFCWGMLCNMPSSVNLQTYILQNWKACGRLQHMYKYLTNGYRVRTLFCLILWMVSRLHSHAAKIACLNICFIYNHRQRSFVY